MSLSLQNSCRCPFCWLGVLKHSPSSDGWMDRFVCISSFPSFVLATCSLRSIYSWSCNHETRSSLGGRKQEKVYTIESQIALRTSFRASSLTRCIVKYQGWNLSLPLSVLYARSKRRLSSGLCLLRFYQGERGPDRDACLFPKTPSVFLKRKLWPLVFRRR